MSSSRTTYIRKALCILAGIGLYSSSVVGTAVADDAQAQDLIYNGLNLFGMASFVQAEQSYFTAFLVADSPAIKHNALNLMGTAALWDENFSLARQTFMLAIAYFGSHGNPSEVVESYKGLGEAQGRLGDIDGAVQTYSVAIDAFKDAVTPIEIGALYEAAGRLLNANGRGTEGIVWYERLYNEQWSYGREREACELTYLSGLQSSGIYQGSQEYRDKLNLVLNDVRVDDQRIRALFLAELAFSYRLANDYTSESQTAEDLFFQTQLYGWHLPANQQPDPEFRNDLVTKVVRENMATALFDLALDPFRAKDPAQLPLLQDVAGFLLTELSDTGTVQNMAEHLQEILDR